MLQALALSLRWLGRKVPSLLLVLKTCGLVRSIAKGLTSRVAATAKCDCGATAKTVRLALHVDEFDFPFDAQGPVTAYRNLCRWHFCSQLPGCSPPRGRIFLLILWHPRIDFIRPCQDAALQVP
jgi:hypothetical protein